MAIRKYQQHLPQLGARVFVDASAVVIGDVELGEDSSVWPLTVIRGDMHRIRIGARTSVQDGSVLHITHAGPFNPDGFPLTIGDEVTIGHKVMLHGCTQDPDDFAAGTQMNALAEEIRREVLAAHVGTEDEVLLETPLSETLFTGYTRLYIPVVVSAPGHKSGEIVHVRLGEYDGERVRAALC